MRVVLGDNELFRQLRRNNSNLMTIWGFRDEYDFLSHMYPATVMVSNVEFPSVENAFHASLTNDPKWFERIRLATPQESKGLSKLMPYRPEKLTIQIPIMVGLDTQKFKNHPELLEKLKSTSNKILIEGNLWHDNFWGDCQCKKCKNIRPLNWAGKILMEVRETLKGE